jgi:hypothetical protein
MTKEGDKNDLVFRYPEFHVFIGNPLCDDGNTQRYVRTWLSHSRSDRLKWAKIEFQLQQASSSPLHGTPGESGIKGRTRDGMSSRRNQRVPSSDDGQAPDSLRSKVRSRGKGGLIIDHVFAHL